ncbi:MAG TPA: endopeptidase La [Thermoanaerobaculia bacterium]|nr:endopeptidase La [Thermoanaerobaculia bacterium]
MSDLIKSGRTTLPVVSLRQLVIFPGITLPIAAGRPETLRAIEAATTAHDNRFFAVLQREDTAEVSPANLHTIGTIARIDQIQRGLGGAQLVVTGLERGIALRVESKSGYLTAVVTEAEELQPADLDDLAFEALYREVRQRSTELGEKSGLPREVAEQVVRSVTEPGKLADLVAGYLELEPADRQSLLETLSVEERLRRVLTHVQRRIGVLDTQEEIKTQVQEELGDRQREIYLREQLKAIQKELGDDGEQSELENLRSKVEALELPAEVRKEVDRELGRLERMGREAMEAQVIRTFVETIVELPWNRRSEERLDLERAAAILEEDHYGLAEVKDRVLEFLSVRLLQQRSEAEAAPPADTPAADAPAAESADGQEGAEDAEGEVAAKTATRSRRKSPILLFAGPPGVGKTSLAQSIARAMGREYVRVSLGGVRDEADIRGHRRTYVAAMPGRIVQGMKAAGSKNPVFLLDEVDKLGASFHGDPAAALLEVLDPAQNHSFTDHYLGVPFDLSEVLFIATANFLQNIPEPLRDRMEVVEFAGYTEAEKLAIARQYLVPRQTEESGLTAERLEFADDALRRVISGYTREAGVRQLEREIGRLARKIARRVAESDDRDKRIVVDEAEVGALLGRPKVHPEHAFEIDQVGVATGMYYTPVGGDIMFVEASTMKGKGKVTLTGQLGEVMQESAHAAWTYARAHAESLGVDPASLDELDLHVHVPAGAIPKDGPSAGVTMATALVSALSKRPVRHDVAMTGEITLSGRVLPIGGVKEKVLGAVRAGIREIVLPKENEQDLEDLPKEVRDQLTVHALAELGEVLAVALRDASFREGRLLFDGGSESRKVSRISPN